MWLYSEYHHLNPDHESISLSEFPYHIIVKCLLFN